MVISHLQKVIQTLQFYRKTDLLQLQSFCSCRPKIWFGQSISSAGKSSPKHLLLLLTFVYFTCLAVASALKVFTYKNKYVINLKLTHAAE